MQTSIVNICIMSYLEVLNYINSTFVFFFKIYFISYLASGIGKYDSVFCFLGSNDIN